MSNTRRIAPRAAMAMTMAAAMTAASMAVAAPPVCGDRMVLINTLADRYHEAPKSMGLSADGGVVEVLASESGSWTMLITRPDGVSCLMASGTNWESVKTLVKGPKV